MSYDANWAIGCRWNPRVVAGKGGQAVGESLAGTVEVLGRLKEPQSSIASATHSKSNYVLVPGTGTVRKAMGIMQPAGVPGTGATRAYSRFRAPWCRFRRLQLCSLAIECCTGAPSIRE